jgi:formylglycine-generating enzyme required for sulfatase activity
MKFVLIPAGTFMMGGDIDMEDPSDYELPLHQVTISKPFYLGIYDVTQGQYEAVMRKNPSRFKGKNIPVHSLSWEDAQRYIWRLNEKEGHSRYRLPTEAEWEYSARAGTTSVFYFGNNLVHLKDYAWYDDKRYNNPIPVGKKRPNDWGLYDMIGNVAEYTEDWFDETYYANSPASDPTGPSSGTERVIRSCSVSATPFTCRISKRGKIGPATIPDYIGFRLVLLPVDSE